MQSTARGSYLENEIKTAPPQKLRLMLIEAALRFGRQANEQWQSGEDEAAGESLVRCQQIVSELLCGINPEQDANLARSVAGVYVYIFRTLVAAHVQHDTKMLTDALSVLDVERETWRQVCDKLAPEVSVHEPSSGNTSIEA